MKGISPIVATVLLIVMVVTLTALVMSFTTTLTKSTTNVIENRTSESVDCSGARVTIDEVFLTNGTSGSATVQIRNDGMKNDLTIVSATLFNRTGGNFSATNSTITDFDVGDVAAIRFSNIGVPTCNDFSFVIVTTNCGGVSDTFRKTPTCLK
jgi:flagellin-like protein